MSLKKRILVWMGALSISMLTGNTHASDVSSLVTDLSIAKIRLKGQAIAILPLQYNGRDLKSVEAQLSETLMTEIVQENEFIVIERSLVSKVLAEVQLQQTGLIDAASASKIGKGLGASALLIGTISDVQNNQALINARLVNTETFEVLAAASVSIERTWDKKAAHPDSWKDEYRENYGVEWDGKLNKVEILAGNSQTQMKHEFADMNSTESQYGAIRLNQFSGLGGGSYELYYDSAEYGANSATVAGKNYNVRSISQKFMSFGFKFQYPVIRIRPLWIFNFYAGPGIGVGYYAGNGLSNSLSDYPLGQFKHDAEGAMFSLEGLFGVKLSMFSAFDILFETRAFMNFLTGDMGANRLTGIYALGGLSFKY